MRVEWVAVMNVFPNVEENKASERDDICLNRHCERSAAIQERSDGLLRSQ
jgi:hypothetical protein